MNKNQGMLFHSIMVGVLYLCTFILVSVIGIFSGLPTWQLVICQWGYFMVYLGMIIYNALVPADKHPLKFVWNKFVNWCVDVSMGL